MEWTAILNEIREFLKEHGDTNGVLILIILVMLLLLYKSNLHTRRQHQEQLKDLRREIDRLVENNNAYRDHFLASIDKSDKKISQEEDES